MDDQTIARVEKKYLITRSEMNELLKRVQKNLQKDEYFSETVLSLYFDDDNFSLAIRSIDRPNFRAKVRLRAYDVPTKSSKVFFEVKSKLVKGKKKVGNKRRLVLPLKDIYSYLNTKSALESFIKPKNNPADDFKNRQIARELDYLINTLHLSPKILISVDRLAYVGKGNSNFRLTFDKNLRFRTKNLRLEKGSDGEKHFDFTPEPTRNIIMEVKTMHSMPPWFVRELSRQKLYPVRFSKYGKIYQLTKERNKNV
ncbi:polyphosphate polymerase domain-containing protein [Candidatus Saccharibacteria bacterium]|nr:polyphosphate polymerase domain-containing protein [Candidatus Saccharibacteria bacterium]